MSNARNLAKLIVDANGDIGAASLDNVPPSNDASALTTGTLPIERIGTGAITNAKIAINAIDSSKLANNSVTSSKLTAGMIVNTTEWFNSTRLVISNSSNYTFSSTSFQKIYSNSYLLVKATWVGRGSYSHWMGLWCEWNGVRNYHGVSMSVENSTSDGTNCPTILVYDTKIASSSTGTALLNFGWTTGSGSADKPFNTFNPDSANNDSRINGSTGSHITVYEVLT